MARHNELGKKGEDRAADYLTERGYVILDRNWRMGHLELDIVCRKDNLLVIAEVKTRKVSNVRPGELLSFRKRRYLRQAAGAYIRWKGVEEEVRFDLLLVTGAGLEVEHIQEAMQVFE